MLKSPVYNFLILEDSEPDAFLLQRYLRKLVEEPRFTVVTNQADYEAALTEHSANVIFSDYRLPQYSGIEALMYARVHAPVVPFVFVTGALNNEELAADTILKGASGFVLKNNLAKLDQLLPSLLDAHGAGAVPAAAPTKKPAATLLDRRGSGANANAQPATADAHLSDDLSAKLAGADAETLAKIRALLGEG